MAESTEENDCGISVGEPDVEIEDVYELMEKLKNHLQDSRMINISMETVLEKILNKIFMQDQLNQRNESTDGAEGLSSEKLSLTAHKLMENTEGPLLPQSFRNFLMNDTFGKPNPSVLPILRGFSWDVDGVKTQLLGFKTQLTSKHKDYKEERRKDDNLKRRIDRLLENIDKEMKVERRDGRVQISMDNFVRGGS